MAKQGQVGRKRDDIARIVAEMHGVTPRYVRMVRNGDRQNEDIMASLVELNIGKNALIKHLESLVKLTPKTKVYAR